jgi:CHAT domain-containing protein/Flp pilus assembly protein TadD
MNNLRVRLLIATLIPAISFTSVTVPLVDQPSLAQTQDSEVEEIEELIDQAAQQILIQILIDQAVKQMQRGQALESIAILQQVLAMARQVKHRELEATILLGIGFNYGNIGQLEKALDYYKQALPIMREVGDRSGEATTLNNIGLVYRNIGQPQKALDYLNQALLIRREVGNLSEVAATLNNIGGVYDSDSIGQPQKALDYFNQALPILREVGNLSEVAVTLNNIGTVYKSIGQPQKALDYYNQALLIRRDVGDRSGEATTLNNIGGVYNNIGQPQKALDYYNQALPILQEFSDRSRVAAIQNNIGRVYDSIGQAKKALDYYYQALPILREVGNRSGEATTLNNIGIVYDRIGQPQKALDYYNQALPIFQEVGNRFGVAATMNNIGLTYEKKGNTGDAINRYIEAIKVIESIQSEITVEELKASFASQGEQIATYKRLINLLWQKGNFEEAFNYVERAKARAFLDQIANGQIDFRAGADSKLLEQEQALKNQIIALRQQLITLRNRPRNKWDTDTIAQTETQLDNHEQDYQDLLLQIKLQSPETADLISVDVASLSEIQDLLDTDTTLIEYFVTEDRTLAFIITKNSFQTVTLNVTREQLTEELTLFRDLTDIDEPHPQELQNLHDWLITPLQPYLNTTNIAIVPHGILHYLPFAALTDGNRYFSDDYALFTLPSASILRFLPEKRKSQTNSLLALGDADVPGLSPLNFARKEVQTIAQLFNSQPLLGKTATETSIWSKATQSGILHLAVHGEYNTNNALFSAIRLAGDTENDGRLEVHEVYGLDLTTTTNLVVLSACQTKIGELNKGDEVVGLNRAFLYAGTPTVIASLWNVDDAATGLLMKKFYTHWQAGMSKAEALRQAQIEVRKDYPHPYFWAGFSLTGDGGR